MVKQKREISFDFNNLDLQLEENLDENLPPYFNPDSVYLDKRLCALDMLFFALAIKSLRDKAEKEQQRL